MSFARLRGRVGKSWVDPPVFVTGITIHSRFDRIRDGSSLNVVLSKNGRLARNTLTRPSPDRYERNVLSHLPAFSGFQTASAAFVGVWNRLSVAILVAISLVQIEMASNHCFDGKFRHNSLASRLAQPK